MNMGPFIYTSSKVFNHFINDSSYCFYSFYSSIDSKPIEIGSVGIVVQVIIIDIINLPTMHIDSEHNEWKDISSVQHSQANGSFYWQKSIHSW